MDPFVLIVWLFAVWLCALGALLGHFVRNRWAPPLFLAGALVAAAMGALAWSHVDREIAKAPLFIPAVLLMGMGVGSTIQIWMDGRKRGEAEDWKKLAIDAEASGLFHVYLRCEEKAGDLFQTAGMIAEATACFEAAWNKQLRKHPIHLSMAELGEKLIVVLKQGRKYEAVAKVSKALAKARQTAEAVLEEELWSPAEA